MERNGTPATGRRDVLYLGALLGAGTGASGLAAGEPDDTDSEPTAETTQVRVEQGGQEWTVDAIEYQGESVESFYSYGDIRASAATPTEIEAGAETSKLFLYDGPNGLSLVIIHDYHNYPNSTSSGGDVTFTFDGLNGNWVIKDDGGDWDRGASSPPQTINWQWNDRNTDGGAFRFADDEFSVTIDPDFVNGINDFQLLSGDAENPDRIDLSMDEPITIERSRAKFDWSPAVPVPGTELTFDASESDGDIDSYEWSFEDGTTATGVTTTKTFDESGRYEVTVTVTRSDGSESTQTRTVPVGETGEAGDGGVTATFDYAPEIAAETERITLDASASESTYEGIDTYEWVLGTGRDDPDRITGNRATYAFDETGEYEIELRVVDSRADSQDAAPVIDTATATLRVEEASEYADFVLDNASPTEIDQIRFTSGFAEDPDTLSEEITWEFGDGATAEGEVVTHQYDAAGTYEVAMTVDGEGTFVKDVEVEQAPIKVDYIRRELRGSKLPPRMPFEEWFTAGIETTDDVSVDEVQFSFLGNEASDDTGFEGEYEASFALEKLSPPSETLEVTAVGTDGDGNTVRHDWERTIGVYSVPDWLEFLLEVANDTSIQRLEAEDREDKRDLPPRIRFTYRPLENLGVGFELPENALGGDDNSVDDDEDDQSYDLSFDAGLWFSPLRGYGSAAAVGGIEADLMTVAVALELGVEGVVGDDFDLERATLLPSASIEITPRSAGPIPLSIPIPGQDKGIGIEPTLSINGSGELLFNSDLSFNEGTLEPGIGLEVSAGIDINLPVVPDGELRGAGSGDVEGAFDIGTDDYNFRGTFFLSGELVFDPGRFLPNAVIEGTFFEYDLAGGGVDATLVAGPEDVSLVEPTTGGEQPLPALSSVDALGADAGAAPTTLDGTVAEDAPRQTKRLTDRPYDDRQPAVATAADGRQAVLWAQQDENKDAQEGNDLIVRWRDDGSWSDPTPLTDDDSDHDSPVLVPAGDRLLAVWRTFDPEDIEGSIDTPEDLNDAAMAAEIAYSVYDGEAWSDPTVLTDTDRLQQRPTVADDGDGWLVAWQSIDLETDDTTVEAAQIAGVGDVTRLDSRSNAANPAASSRSDDRVDLAYATLADDGSTTGVVHQRLADGNVDTEDSYDAAGAATIDVADGRLVWVTNPANDPAITEIRNGSQTDLSLRADVQEVRDLALLTDGESHLLSYRANLEDGPNRDIVYRLDRGDGWIYDRRAAGSIEEELVVKDADVAFVDSSTVITTYATRDTDIEAVGDVFATTQAFAPAYALTATVEEAAAGEETTVEYTVENRGDTAGSTAVSLTIEAAEETTATIDALNAGASVTDTATVTVPEDGRIDASLSVDEPTLGTEPTAVELVAATPALLLGDVDVARPAGDSATATIECYNSGGATAEGVTMALDGADGDRIGSGTVDAIAAGETATVTVEFDPTAIESTDRQTLLLDPDGTLSDEAIVRGQEPIQLLTPDLTVEDVRYREDADVTFVEATIANAGVGPAEIEYRVTDTDGQELGTESVSLPPATDGVTQSRRLRIEAPDLTVGQSVVHEADVVGVDDTGEGLDREETVGTILPGTYFTVSTYLDDNGNVDTAALRDAVGDWRKDRLDTQQVIEVIDTWQQS